MMNQEELTTRITQHEPIAKTLEPNLSERQKLTDMTTSYIQNILEEYHDKIPAYFHNENEAKDLEGAKYFPFPEESSQALNFSEILSALDTHVVRDGINGGSPRFFGYVPGGGLYPCALADYIAASINRFSGMFFASPAAVRLENMLVRWSATIAGYDPKVAKGFLSSGASIATLSAYVCARDEFKVMTGGREYCSWKEERKRNKKKEEEHKGGVAVTSTTNDEQIIIISPKPRPLLPHNFVIYMTKEVHSCNQKALNLCGLASVPIHYVKTDSKGKMDVHDLERLLKQDSSGACSSGSSSSSSQLSLEDEFSDDDSSSGSCSSNEEEGDSSNNNKKKDDTRHKRRRLQPWLIIASAGTVNAGVVDPLRAIGQLAKAYKCWYHIDGAYGGYLALSSEGRKVIDGLELSDSITMDPHKGLFLPYGTGMLIVKNGKHLLDSHSVQASYLHRFVDTNDDHCTSSTDLSPELSRHFRALRLWIPIQLFGVNAFRTSINEKILLTRWFWHEIQKPVQAYSSASSCTVPVSLFEVGMYPELSIATFRLKLPPTPTPITSISSSSSTATKDGEPFVERQNKINHALLSKIMKDGTVFISSTVMDGGLVTLRLAILVFRVHMEQVQLAVSVFREKGLEVWKEFGL